MNLPRIYSFNLYWRGVVSGTAFYAVLAFLFGRLAGRFNGAIFVCLLALSLMFTVFAGIMMLRRVFCPRRLELSEESILFPDGFPKTRIIRIPFEEIIRVSEMKVGDQRIFSLITGKGRFEIRNSSLPDTASYNAVKDFICARISVGSPAPAGPSVSAVVQSKWFPDPFLSWREPETWSRYRARAFASKPLFPRVAKATWFFARCFGILVLPWSILYFCGAPSLPWVAYLSLALAVTLFFTSLHWLNSAYPVRLSEISFRENGITQFFGKQIWDHNYCLFSGWAVIERPFEGGVLPILLLRWPYGVRTFAFPDMRIRDQLTQIFHDKRVPQVPDLKPSWE
jgi:hypothetical protein